MQVCRNIMGLAVMISVSLGPTGCGGAPTTGEQVVESKPDEAAKKKMLDGYLNKMARPKGQRKAMPH
jgi:hypothetical protein